MPRYDALYRYIENFYDTNEITPEDQEVFNELLRAETEDKFCKIIIFSPISPEITSELELPKILGERQYTDVQNLIRNNVLKEQKHSAELNAVPPVQEEKSSFDSSSGTSSSVKKSSPTPSTSGASSSSGRKQPSSSSRTKAVSSPPSSVHPKEARNLVESRMSQPTVDVKQLQMIYECSEASLKTLLVSEPLKTTLAINLAVLSSDDLLHIQKHAVDLHCIKLIGQSTNIQILTDFQNDPGYGKAETLKLPPTAVKVMIATGKHNDVKVALENRLKVLNKEQAPSNFETEINAMSPTDLLAIPFPYDADLRDFIATLPDNCKQVDESVARSLLATKCLTVCLERMDLSPLLEALRAPTSAKLIEKLKNGHKGTRDYYVEDAERDPENLKVRALVFKQIIKKLQAKHIGSLKTIGTSTDADGVREIVKDMFGLGNAKFITQENYNSIQQDARSRLFAIKGAKTELVAFLSELSVTKQMELLNDDTDAKLNQVKNARSKADILRILDVKPEEIRPDLIEAAVAEKQQLDLFKFITNSKIAKVLTDFTPKIKLDPGMVRRINHVIQDEKLANHTSCTKLVTRIATECKIDPSDKATFYEKFDVNGSGTKLLKNPAQMKKIQEQQQNNRALLALQNRDPNTLLNRLLNLDKNYELTRDHISSIKKLANKSSTREEFIKNYLDKVRRDFPGMNTTEANLQNVMSDLDFRRVKTEIRVKAIKGSDPDRAMKAVQFIAAGIFENKVEREKFVNATEVDAVAKVEPIHLNTPEFKMKIRSGDPGALKREAHFKQLLDDCTIKIDKLHRDLATIKKYLLRKNLPNSSDPASPVQDEITKLRTDLKTQRRNVIESLEIYKVYQFRLNDIVQAIEHAKRDDVDYMSPGKGFSAPKLITVPEAEYQRTLTAAAAPSSAAATLSNTRNMTESVTDDKLLVGQERASHFDGGTSPHYYTEKLGLKENERIFSIKGFPPANATNNNADRVMFAMGMARDILLRSLQCKYPPSAENPIELSGGPGDTEALRYLWTALMVLGKNSNLKFDASAIECRNSKFNPADQKGWWPFRFGQSSLHKSDFAGKNYVTQAENSYNTALEKTFDKHKVVEKAEKPLPKVPGFEALKRQWTERREASGSAPVDKLSEVKTKEFKNIVPKKPVQPKPDDDADYKSPYIPGK